MIKSRIMTLLYPEAPTNYTDKYGQTVVHVAKNAQVVDFILDKDPDLIDVQDNVSKYAS